MRRKIFIKMRVWIVGMGIVMIVRRVGIVGVKGKVEVVMRGRMYVWNTKMMRAIWGERLINPCTLL